MAHLAFLPTSALFAYRLSARAGKRTDWSSGASLNTGVKTVPPVISRQCADFRRDVTFNDRRDAGGFASRRLTADSSRSPDDSRIVVRSPRLS